MKTRTAFTIADFAANGIFYAQLDIMGCSIIWIGNRDDGYITGAATMSSHRSEADARLWADQNGITLEN